jgi:hypothetical protein
MQSYWGNQSPDTTRFVADNMVYDRNGASLGSLPWPGKGGGEAVWSADGRQLCHAIPAWQASGAPMKLEVAGVGERPHPVASGFGIYGDNAVYPVLACDKARDRAIVASFGQGLAPSVLWVIRLSTGSVIRTLTAPGRWVTASSDGLMLARTIAVGNRTRVTIEKADDGTILKSIDDFSAQGFSGDGSLLIGVERSSATVLLNWRDGKRLWSSTAGPYGGFLAEAGGRHVAIGIGFVGGSDQADVYLVGPDGSAVLLPEQIRAGLRY